MKGKGHSSEGKLCVYIVTDRPILGLHVIITAYVI